MLAFQTVLGGTPEKQSPAARPGPHPAKADQCQHRCFNVHNIYKPDSSRQFIWNLFFKKNYHKFFIQKKKKKNQPNRWETRFYEKGALRQQDFQLQYLQFTWGATIYNLSKRNSSAALKYVKIELLPNIWSINSNEKYSKVKVKIYILHTPS